MSNASSSYPVVLFSPGVRSARFQSMTAVEELVSHGYIVWEWIIRIRRLV